MELRRAIAFLCCIFVTFIVSCGTAFNCHFETETECQWIRTGELEWVSAANLTGAKVGPATDSNGNERGHFLYLPGSKHATNRLINITSPVVDSSDLTCRLVFSEHSYGVPVDAIKVVVMTSDKLSTIIGDKCAHGTNRWEKIDQRLGNRNSPFQVVIEFVPADENSHLAIDDVRLENCFPDPLPSSGACDLRHHFDCGEKCIDRSHVCDLHVDCARGEDETQECEKISRHAKCNFEMNQDEGDVMCGWSNDQTDHLDWIRHKGALDKRGPPHDYTYKNSSGGKTRESSNLIMQSRSELGSNAVLNSASFSPPPKYHGQIHSPFYNSCQIRFAYFMSGMSSGALALNCIEKPPRREEKETVLWRKSGNQKDDWIRATVPLPKLLYNYRLQFVGSRGLRNHGYIALDDITLSPECFGIGVNLTDEEKRGGHRSKFNEKVQFPATLMRYKFDTCGAKGRFGPTSSMCNNSYSRSGLIVDVVDGRNMSGIQVWTVNNTGFYSIIAQGASGGKGARTAHTSHGARAHAVLKWWSGDTIHILVGQEGSSTCQWGHCSQPLTQRQPESASGIRGLAHLKAASNSLNRGSGGGGGGATYVFQMDDSGRARPLLVAAGGGGFALDDPMPDTVNPDGRGFNRSVVSRPGTGPRNGAGGGGGWSPDFDANMSSSHPSRGLSLLEGGIGGPPCTALAHWEANGGFGGGGGACHSGGGGGGFAGGDTADPDHSEENGEGGVSWLPPRFSAVTTGLVDGPGVVEIYSAFEGCGCSFLCVVLDFDANEHACICDENWQLASDNVSCVALSGVDRTVIMGMPRHLLIVLLCVVVLMICIGSATFFLYHRYRRQKVKNIRQELFGNAELQLNRLRQQTGGMVTEYNPNYEFGGSTCTIQDLKEVSRESLTLVKALGQGAFGEVYQGCLHNLPGETRDLPVAVKTLPELSSSQAEMDFLMEALIMREFYKDPDVISAALPVFHRPPSMERDTTVMRPPDSEDRFLHVQRTPDSDLPTPASTDYLIPIPASNYSINTERTDLTSSVDSIDKLLELDEPRVPAPSPIAPNGKKRTGGYTSIPTFDDTTLPPNNNFKSSNKSSLALDPSILAKQLSARRPLAYMNVAASATKEQKVDPFIIGNHFTEKEVNC
uniref:MAM domain-containing protein n=1 Tax=Strigamia maritima TaxID=126957 RepID=T1JGN5_STRMM